MTNITPQIPSQSLPLSRNQSAFAMEEFMFSSGKIYVVIAVVSIIFVGLAFYLFSMDKKLRKLEQAVNKSKEQASPEGKD